MQNITEIINKNAKKYLDKNLKNLIYQLTGIEILIKNIPYWIIGLPNNSVSLVIDKNGLLKTSKYKKNGKTWKLNYLDYHQDANCKEPNLPKRIELIQRKIHIALHANIWSIN